MSQYSEMMGSFVRTGNYPLEANYIFQDEAALKEFFEDPINKTLLHQGLFKIVLDDGTGHQALFWVEEIEDELQFSKVISADSIGEIDATLADIQKKLENEITERKKADTAIWGTRDLTEIDEDLNNILKLSDAVLDLREKITDFLDKVDSLKDDMKAVVGTTEDDIQAYLKTLDYENLTQLSETLHHFLTEYDEDTESFDTWPELQAFLAGFNDKDTLLQILTDLWHNIQGSPLPNNEFRTLRGIEDIIETFVSYSKNRMDNIQSEIDQTQVGVGLSGDGSYNADNETYYLKEATSVMNALKILDSLINEAINNCNIVSEDTETVAINIVKEPTKTTISAQVKVSSELGNDIVIKNDGIYHNVDSEYENGVLTIKVNGNVRQQHVLGLSSIVEDAKYDPTTETIIIIFKLQNGEKQIVNIPAGALIQEWIIDNSDATKVVELEKVRVVDGPDKLSADVRISTNKYNILEKDGNTLLVSGTADNIVYDGDVTVKSKLDNLTEQDEKHDQRIAELDEKLDNEIQRSTETDKEIQDALNREIERSTQRDDLLAEAINDEIARAKDAEKILTDDLAAEVKRSTDKDTEHEKAITDETNRAKLAEQELTNNLTNEISRAETEEKRISDLLDTTITNLSDEVKRATAKETELNTKIDNEITRAIEKENQIALDLKSETDRASNKETELELKIENLTSELEKNLEGDNTLSAKVDKLNQDLTDETNRAKLAEQELTNKINLETERATNAETLLEHKLEDTNTALETESNRAQEAEQVLTTELAKTNKNLQDTNDSLAAEIERSTNKDSELQTAIDTETARATDAENIIAKEVSDVIDKCIVEGATTAEEAYRQLIKLGDNYATVEQIGKTLKGFLEDNDLVDSSINKWQEIESFLQGITDSETLLGLLEQISNNTGKEIEELTASLENEISRAKAEEARLEGLINTNAENLASEIERSTAKDEELTTNLATTNTKLDSEITRAKEAEKVLQDNITAEYNRAQLAETTLQNNIDKENLRATAKEELLDTKIGTVSDSVNETNTKLATLTETVNDEISRSTLEDIEIKNNLTNLQEQITSNANKDKELTDLVNSINKDLVDESNRAQLAEQGLANDIANETLRATNAEAQLDEKLDNLRTDLTSEVNRSVAKDEELLKSIQTNATDIAAEVNRAQRAEDVLQSNIDAEATRINTLQESLANEVERSTNKDEELANSIASTNSDVAKLQSDLQAENIRANAEEKRLNDLIDAVQANLDKEIDRSTTKDNDLTTALTTESERAKLAEQTNAAAIQAEADRAKRAEEAEVLRATAKEEALDHRIDDVQASINTEKERAEAAEAELQEAIDTVATNLDSTNQKLTAEIKRSTDKDAELEAAINAEVTRATTAETTISTEISDLINWCIASGTTTAKDAKAKLAELGTNYASVLAIGQTLKSFLEGKDLADSTINKWQEIESFLSGISDTETLTGILADIQANLDASLEEVKTTVKAEEDRAKRAELALDDKIERETIRATGEETRINDELHHHIEDYFNPHHVTKDQVGLGNVDNTSDKDKPVSDSVQEALDNKSDVGHTHTKAEIVDLDSTPTVKGVISLISELPTDANVGDSYVLASEVNPGEIRYVLMERGDDGWIQKFLNTGSAAVVEGDGIWQLESDGVKRMNVLINEEINSKADVALNWTNEGLSAKFIWGEYD